MDGGYEPPAPTLQIDAVDEHPEPHLVEQRAAGIDFPQWGSVFVALGVGAGIGFFLSRILGHKFDRLRNATDQIEAGNLSVAFETTSTNRDIWSEMADSGCPDT